jgi:phenylpropionate dioxygenase-like ring-hydroxylating dioxygenase large terminal subunit
MLSKENNELLCRVGPGTPMGELLRRYWMPALLEEEVGEPDGAPIRLRLLGEDLICFRDSKGRIGIVEAYCAHRRAGLYFARNEDCGLRCIYHGWKFDVDGNCVDIPSEPDHGASFKNRPRIVSYPNAVRGGVVWIYMGPPEFASQPPDFEWSTLPVRQRTATKRLQQCNWAQAVEGGIDSSHISYLHGRTDTQPKTVKHGETLVKYWDVDRSPVLEVKETPYGMLIAARRDAGENDAYYWRITQFLLPFYTMIPPRGAGQDSRDAWYYGHAWVPIDDEHTWSWSFSASPHREYSDDELKLHGARDGFWGPTDENYRPVLNKQNDYRISRDRQRKENFSGIDGIPNQDSAVQESMQPVVDRTRERLGHSDRAIVNFRRTILRMAEENAAGQPPESAQRGDWYKVRSAFALLGRSVKFDEGAAWLLNVVRRKAAE